MGMKQKNEKKNEKKKSKIGKHELVQDHSCIHYSGSWLNIQKTGALVIPKNGLAFSFSCEFLCLEGINFPLGLSIMDNSDAKS